MSASTTTCPSCGTAATGAQTFCGSCGTPLTAAAPPPPPTDAPAPAAEPAPAPAATPAVNRFPALLGLGSAAVLLVSSFLTWASIDTDFGSATVGGFDEGGRGVIMTTAAIVVAILSGLMLQRPVGRAVKIGLIVTAAIALLFALAYFSDVSDVAVELPGLAEATAGAGPYVAALGAVGALVAGIRTKRTKRS